MCLLYLVCDIGCVFSIDIDVYVFGQLDFFGYGVQCVLDVEVFVDWIVNIWLVDMFLVWIGLYQFVVGYEYCGIRW